MGDQVARGTEADHSERDDPGDPPGLGCRGADAVIRLESQPERPVRARRAEGEEGDRLWQRWAEVDEGLDALAASRAADTPVVLFEPRDAATDQTD